MNANIDISNVVLSSERLTLRAFNQNDLIDFYQYASVNLSLLRTTFEISIFQMLS